MQQGDNNRNDDPILELWDMEDDDLFPGLDDLDDVDIPERLHLDILVRQKNIHAENGIVFLKYGNKYRLEAQGIPIESPTRVQLMVYSTFEASGTFRVDPSVTAKLANIVLTARSNYHFVPAEQNIFEITSMTKRRGSNAPDHCILFKLVGIDADTSLVLGESLPFVVVRRLDQQRLYRRAALRELRRCRGEDVPADPKPPRKRYRSDPLPALHAAFNAAQQNGIPFAALMTAIAVYWPEAAEFIPHSGVGNSDWFPTIVRVVVVLFWFSLGCLVQFVGNKFFDRFVTAKEKDE